MNARSAATPACLLTFPPVQKLDERYKKMLQDGGIRLIHLAHRPDGRNSLFKLIRSWPVDVNHGTRTSR